jgi:SPX domain protein involved in polyphosphate accumulation
MQKEGYTKLQDFRYERKYVAPGLSRQEVEALVKMHPAMFSEIYHIRHVNNIYFDSLAMKNYFANIDGLQHRVKCRIRWYGDLFGEIDKPILELKIKNGLMGKKESYLLENFTLDENFRLETLREIFRKSEVPDIVELDLMTLQPSLLNRYKRKYFQTADRNYRITIDTDLEYYRIDPQGNTFLQKSRDDFNIVVELKYNKENDPLAESISRSFPFRLSRNSKYVNGIQRVLMT